MDGGLTAGDYASIAAAGGSVVVAGATYMLARTTRSLASASNQLVEETLKSRIDALSPRVRVMVGDPEWPPYRKARAGDVEARWTPGQELVLPRQGDGRLTVRAVGVITNEGASSARVTLDDCAEFVSGRNPFDPRMSVKIPVCVGPKVYVLPPGDSGVFHFDVEKTIKSWIDEPLATAQRGTMKAGVCDLYETGACDTVEVAMVASCPLEAVEGDASRWRIARAGVTALVRIAPVIRRYENL